MTTPLVCIDVLQRYHANLIAGVRIENPFIRAG